MVTSRSVRFGFEVRSLHLDLNIPNCSYDKVRVILTNLSQVSPASPSVQISLDL